MRSVISLLLFRLLLLAFSVSEVQATGVDVTNVIKNLQLSSSARIFTRGEEGYAERTKRWQYWKAPDVAAVVEVATDEDVSETIRFANSHNIPFTAFSGGHGGISSLSKIQNGIQIHMRKLNSITISPDGTYATIGGGAKVKELRDTLWQHEKWTTHGICECPGLTSVALGGGHGALEDRYGLLSDQIISLNVVLANGTAIQVSDSSHADLFWAMRGAGHNYGIVTSLKYKIYDIPDVEVGGKIWSKELFIYEATPENIKKIYGLAKELMDSGKQPDGLLIYGVVGTDPLGSGKIVIMHTVLWNGPLSSIKQHTQGFHDLNPLIVDPDEGTFLDTSRWFFVDDDAVPCRIADFVPGAGLVRFPVDSKTYNVDALADATENFVDFMKKNEAFAGSMILIEQYSTRAVREIDHNKGAIPWRDNVLLIAPAIVYPSLDLSTSPPSPNAHLDDLAWKWGEELRQILVDGVKDLGGHYSYVNYAYGGESEEEVYGKENLARLRELKSVYDPDEKFRFYAPIQIERHTKERERDEL